MSMYYEPDKNTIELHYDSGSTEDDMVALYTRGDRYVTSLTPFDPASC